MEIIDLTEKTPLHEFLETVLRQSKPSEKMDGLKSTGVIARASINVVVHTYNFHMFVTLIMSYNQNFLPVLFVINTSASATAISKSTSRALGLNHQGGSFLQNINIHGVMVPTAIIAESSSTSEVNTLGADFFELRERAANRQQ